MIEHPGRTKPASADHAQEALDAFEADGVPRELVRDGKIIAVIGSPHDFSAGDAKGDIWKDYDPAKVDAALDGMARALRGVDLAKLERDAYASRRGYD